MGHVVHCDNHCWLVKIGMTLYQKNLLLLLAATIDDLYPLLGSTNGGDGSSVGVVQIW